MIRKGNRPMELEEMQAAWARIDRKLDEHLTLSRNAIREAINQRASGRLRPLFWGQIVQILVGTVIIVLAVAYWSGNLKEPHRFVCGLVMHVYGVVAIMLAGMTLSAISAIEWSGPVSEIQRKLDRLRSLRIVAGAIVGLSWWVLWPPFAQVVFGLLGADFYAIATATFVWSIIGGIGGIIASCAFYRWSQRHSNRRFRKRILDQATGVGITQAFADLARIQEHEENRQGE